MTEERYRVYNRCKHAIGVQLMNGMQLNIKPGSFQLLTASDILYIESICGSSKFFSQKMLEPVDASNMPMTLDAFGLAPDTNVPVHMNDDDIAAMLKKPVNQVKAWLSNIDDPAELHAIYLVARQMDLTTSKLKLLREKIPEKDWLSHEE